MDASQGEEGLTEKEFSGRGEGTQRSKQIEAIAARKIKWLYSAAEAKEQADSHS